MTTRPSRRLEEQYLPLDDRRDPGERARAPRLVTDAEHYAVAGPEPVATRRTSSRRSRGAPRAPRCSPAGRHRGRGRRARPGGRRRWRARARTWRSRPTRSWSWAGCSRWSAAGNRQGPPCGRPWDSTRLKGDRSAMVLRERAHRRPRGRLTAARRTSRCGGGSRCGSGRASTVRRLFDQSKQSTFGGVLGAGVVGGRRVAASDVWVKKSGAPIPLGVA